MKEGYDEKDRSSMRKSSDGSRSFGPGEADEVVDSRVRDNEFEVFKVGEDVVNFRTVSWPKASVIFLKSQSQLPYRYFHLRFLTLLQSYSQLASWVYLLPCTLSALLAVLYLSLDGAHSIPTTRSFKANSEADTLTAIPSPIWRMSLAACGFEN